jgi:hypothetical protein
LDERKQNEIQDAFNQRVLDEALQNNRITHEEYDKAIGMSRNQRTGVVAGIQANLHDQWQKNLDANRQALANVNTALAQAEYYRMGGRGGGGTQRVYSPDLGANVTPVQANTAYHQSIRGALMDTYGVTPEQLLDSSQHKAGTLQDAKDLTSTFTPKSDGPYIQIGGDTGFVMARQTHEALKRRLFAEGYGAKGEPPARYQQPPPSAGAGVKPVRPAGKTSGQMVPVIDPNGVRGFVKAEDLNDALDQGYTVATRQ